MTNEELRAKLPSRFAQYPLFNCADVNDDAAVLIAYQYCVIQEQAELVSRSINSLVRPVVVNQPATMPYKLVSEQMVQDIATLEWVLGRVEGANMAEAEEAWFRIKKAWMLDERAI